MAQSIDHPRVSVIMPVYNAEVFIAQAIDSILEQTFKSFEFIIINDGSTDASLKIIRSYNDPRIRVVSRKNKGLVATLNEGIKLARGEYIARMDADDISYPDRFSQQVVYLDKNKDIDLVGSQIITMDEAGNMSKGIVSKPIDPEDVRLLLGHGSIIAHPTVMMKLHSVKEVGGYREKYWPAEDYDLWLRMAEHGELANLPSVLLKYRISKKGISQSKGVEQSDESMRLAREWRKKHLDYSRAVKPTAVYQFVRRYKKQQRSLASYSLQVYLRELLYSIREDILQSSKPMYAQVYLLMKLKASLFIVRKYG